jgi:hypothetical protein
MVNGADVGVVWDVAIKEDAGEMRSPSSILPAAVSCTRCFI